MNEDWLKSFRYLSLIEYLQDIGWKVESSSNQIWYILHSLDDENNPSVEIVLPQDERKPDSSLLIKNAFDTICVLLRIEQADLLFKVKHLYQDVLKARNLETNQQGTISIKVASHQVLELKHLVAYSACSEDTKRPYFLTAQSASAKRMIEEYQFGHTFKGSFGFVIEGPRLSMDHFSLQHSAIPEIVNEMQSVPEGRRVMERIVRGLVKTREATLYRDPKPLIEDYFYGFNSNMCTAIANMSMGKKIPIEFSIEWSPRFQQSNSLISQPGPIQLSEPSYIHLEYAADMLSQIEPIKIQISGLVTSLSSNDNPMDLDTSRTIRIKWHDQSEQKITNIDVQLSSSDYQIAIKAHQDWRPVTIVGELKQAEGHCFITNYEKFEIT